MSLWETIDELLDDPANTSNGNQSQTQSIQKAYNEDELDENELLGINEEEDDLFGDLSGSENVVSESRSDEKSYPVSIQASSSDLAVGSEEDVKENLRKSSSVNNKSNGNKESEFFFSATSVDKTDEDGLDIGQAETDDLIENNKTDKRTRDEYKSETEKSASETDVSTKRTDDDDDDENDEKRTSRSSHWSERNVDKPSQPVDSSNAQNYNNRRNFNNNNNNRNSFNNRPMGGMNNMNKRPHMNGQDGLLPIPQLMQHPVRPNNSLMYQQKPPQQQQQQQPPQNSMGGSFFNATGNQLIRPMLDSNNMNMMQQFKTNLGMNQFVPNQFGLQQQVNQQHPIQQQPQIQAPMQLQQPRAPMMQYPSMNQNSFPPQQQRYPNMMNPVQPMNNQASGIFPNQNDLNGTGMMHNSQVVMPLMPHQSQFMMNQFQKPNMGSNMQHFPMMPSQPNVMPAQQQPQPAILNSLMPTPQVVMPQSMTPQQPFNAVQAAQQMKPNHVFINPSFIAKQNMPSSAPPAAVSNNEEKKPARSRKDLDMLLEKRLAEELSKSREDERNKKKANSPPPLKRKSSEMSSDKQSSGSSKHSKMPRQNENKRQVESVSSSSSSNGKRVSESEKKEEKIVVEKPVVQSVTDEQTSMIVIDDPDYYKKLEEQKRKREEVLRMKNEKRNQRILELKKTENLNGGHAAENSQKSASSSSTASGFGSRTVIQISSDEPTGRIASLCSAVDSKHKSTR